MKLEFVGLGIFALQWVTVENKMRSTENVTAEISQTQNNGKLTYADILRGKRGV